MAEHLSSTSSPVLPLCSPGDGCTSCSWAQTYLHASKCLPSGDLHIAKLKQVALKKKRLKSLRDNMKYGWHNSPDTWSKCS